MTLTEDGVGPGMPAAPRPRLGDKPLTVVSPKSNILQRVVAIWRYRELLVAMTRKELKVQYKDSVLGFLWSMLNPLVGMLVYFFVFQIVLKAGIPRFAIFLMAGSLAWNFFMASVSGACGSIVGNAGIVKKVAFPREIPVLAQLGSNAVQFGFQSLVLIGFMIGFWNGPAVAYLPLLIPALLAIALLAAALGLFLAAVNVRLRDMQHLLAVALQVWFWATPIVYQYERIAGAVQKSHQTVYHVLFFFYRLNPMTPVVLTFQRALYGATSPIGAGGKPVSILPNQAGIWWYLSQLLIVIGVSLLLLFGAMHVFGRREGSFADEL